MSRKPVYVKAILEYYRAAAVTMSSMLSDSATYPLLLVATGALAALVLDVGGYIK